MPALFFPLLERWGKGEAEGLILQTHAAFRDPGAGWNDMWQLIADDSSSYQPCF